MMTPYKTKLLIVDASNENIVVLEDILANLDVEFVRSLSGKDALNKTINHDFDLAIIDIQMPEMDGYELLKKLRQNERTQFLPVILLTVFPFDTVQMIEGFERGIVDFILKPVVPELLVGKVKVFLDIGTQRKYLEKYSKKLQETHELYRRVIENSNGVPYRFNCKTKVYEFYGNGYQYLFGINEPILAFDDLKKIRKEVFCINPTDMPDVEKYREAFLKGEINQYRADFRITNFENKEKWINDSSVPVVDEVLKKVVGSFGIMQDITDRKNIEQQLRQAQKMEAVGRLASGVAHDFNNMLTVIRGYSELLLSRFEKDDPIHKKIKQINSSAERTEKLTRQLLTFSREQIIQPKVLDINIIIKNIQNMLKRLIGENINLYTEFGSNIGNIKADSGQVEQVIMNLVINSRDALPNGGVIKIKAKNTNIDTHFVETHEGARVGQFVQMSINDNGTGISEEVRPKIFDPFFTTKDKDKGTGLGLSTVYGIVKQSGAYIWVDSETGVGTTFHILFPFIKEKVEKSKKIKSKQSDLKGTETILIVEDEFDVRNLVRESLQFYGYQILETDNGKKALALSKKHKNKIDLVLTDLVMPEMSGQELGEKLRICLPDIPIIYMSGYSDNAVFKNNVIDKKSGFLNKPFTPIDIAKKIREILDNQD